MTITGHRLDLLKFADLENWTVTAAEVLVLFSTPFSRESEREAVPIPVIVTAASSKCENEHSNEASSQIPLFWGHVDLCPS